MQETQVWSLGREDPLEQGIHGIMTGRRASESDGLLTIVKMKVSCVWLFVTPRTVAHQAPLFMEFSRQEYWRVTIPFSRGSSQPRDRTQISHISGRFFTNWAIMQIKTTIRCHLTLVRMAIIKKSTNNKCWRGYGEKRTFLHCWCGYKLIHPLWKTVWRFLKKKNKLGINCHMTQKSHYWAYTRRKH